MMDYLPLAPSLNSERQFRPEAETAFAAVDRVIDFAEIAGSETAARIIEARRVGDVEARAGQSQPQAFAQGERARQRKVITGVSRTAHGVAPDVAEFSCSRIAEGSDVEVPLTWTYTAENARVADKIRTRRRALNSGGSQADAGDVKR